jgi:hypothetical protein
MQYIGVVVRGGCMHHSGVVREQRHAVVGMYNDLRDAGVPEQERRLIHKRGIVVRVGGVRVQVGGDNE